MDTTPVISVRDLRKAYGGRVVVDGLDLDVGEGEIVGLIGANGAGKTTTVECIQGLRRPDEGTIRVLGLDPARDAGRVRQLVGSQLQDSALPDRLRVGEAVELFAGTQARDGAELLERFDLIARRRSPFAGLSGGERQRLFLVLALLNRPRLVILDELTQGLDPAARRNVCAAVAQLQEDGTTVLLVTHELDEAEVLCGRVIALRAGRVLDSGTPAELVGRHAGWARMSFTTRVPPDRLRGLVGVQRVDVVDGRTVVVGERCAIAHVGAALVAAGDVPDDITVEQPDLEGALLRLLDAPSPSEPSRELVTL